MAPDQCVGHTHDRWVRICLEIDLHRWCIAFKTPDFITYRWLCSLSSFLWRAVCSVLATRLSNCSTPRWPVNSRPPMGQHPRWDRFVFSLCPLGDLAVHRARIDAKGTSGEPRYTAGQFAVVLLWDRLWILAYFSLICSVFRQLFRQSGSDQPHRSRFFHAHC